MLLRLKSCVQHLSVRSLGLIWAIVFVAMGGWVISGSFALLATDATSHLSNSITLPYVPLSSDGAPAGLLPQDAIAGRDKVSDDELGVAAEARCQAENKFLGLISQSSLNLSSLERCEATAKEAALSMYGGAAVDFLHAEAEHYRRLASDPNAVVAFPYSGPVDAQRYLQAIDGAFAQSFSTVLLEKRVTPDGVITDQQKVLFVLLAEAASMVLVIFLSGAAFLLLRKFERSRPLTVEGAQ